MHEERATGYTGVSVFPQGVPLAGVFREAPGYVPRGTLQGCNRLLAGVKDCAQPTMLAASTSTPAESNSILQRGRVSELTS